MIRVIGDYPMEKIVFDIETKNSFADVGGRDNLKALEASLIGAYSYDQDKYFTFEENQFDDFGEMARNAGMLVTFSGRRFDVPVMEKYYKFKITSIPHFDILDEVENALGRRVSLNALAEANLGVGEGKTGHGMDAIEYYKRGEIQKLKDYCLQDVKITKEIFDLILKQGYLWIPERGIPQMTKLPIAFKEPEAAGQSSLF